MSKASIQLKQNCRRSLQCNITCILYTSWHNDGHMDKRTDRLVPVYPNENLFCGNITRRFSLIATSVTISFKVWGYLFEKYHGAIHHSKQLISKTMIVGFCLAQW